MVEYTSQVRHDYGYFHKCGARVKILKDPVSRVK